MELVVDLFVHGGGDDADSGEGVGDRVDAHLGHEQRQQEDFVLRNVVVLQKKAETERTTSATSSTSGRSLNPNPNLQTYQQDSDGHERSSSRGNGAVHQDDVVFADVFGQAKVVKLRRGGGGTQSTLERVGVKENNRLEPTFQKGF